LRQVDQACAGVKRVVFTAQVTVIARQTDTLALEKPGTELLLPFA